jgi:hypothetical protein
MVLFAMAPYQFVAFGSAAIYRRFPWKNRKCLLRATKRKKAAINRRTPKRRMAPFVEG